LWAALWSFGISIIVETKERGNVVRVIYGVRTWS
jgi:hypothetical protein